LDGLRVLESLATGFLGLIEEFEFETIWVMLQRGQRVFGGAAFLDFRVRG
jgi:hypothetical protein